MHVIGQFMHLHKPNLLSGYRTLSLPQKVSTCPFWLNPRPHHLSEATPAQMFCSVGGRETSKSCCGTRIWGGGRAKGEEEEGGAPRGRLGRGECVLVEDGAAIYENGRGQVSLGTEASGVCAGPLPGRRKDTHVSEACTVLWQGGQGSGGISPALTPSSAQPQCSQGPTVPRKATPLLSPR